MQAPIPAHVVTGPLGSGKTSAIARLLATKPPEQNWVVLLNEFSDAGIDALTIASAARGAFDVRLVPGGCLCCAGEQDFRRNLQELVTVTRPDRLIIEPSGLGHPGGIVDELLGYESRGLLRLAGVVGLIDPQHLRPSGPTPGSELQAQLEIADALLLSKPDLADAADRTRFAALVAGLFPVKAWSGELQEGLIPAAAFEPPQLSRAARATGMDRPARHRAERALEAAHGHDVPRFSGDEARDASGSAAHDAATADGAMAAAAGGQRDEVRHLGHRALQWRFVRAVGFAHSRLESLFAELGEGRGPMGTGAEGVVRLKGVFRVSEDDWVLAQAGRGFSELRATSWRRDSRVELLVAESADFSVADWDAAWSACQCS